MSAEETIFNAILGMTTIVLTILILAKVAAGRVGTETNVVDQTNQKSAEVSTSKTNTYEYTITSE